MNEQDNGAPGREHLDWKRRQALQPAAPRLIEPTLPERINRLRPSERHELGQLLRSMKLRKIIKRTLAEAFWEGQVQEIAQDNEHATMQRLRRRESARESLRNYEGALTSFEPTVLTEQQPSIIEVPR